MLLQRREAKIRRKEKSPQPGMNGVLRRFQQYLSHITATVHIIHAFLGFTSTRLGSEVSCPRSLPRKNPDDPVRLEPRIPGLRVKHFTTEPRGTHRGSNSQPPGHESDALTNEPPGRGSTAFKPHIIPLSLAGLVHIAQDFSTYLKVGRADPQ